MLSVTDVLSAGGGFDAASWVTAIGTLILVGGVVVAVFQLRDSRMSRLAQGSADFSSRWDSNELIETRREISNCSTDEVLRDRVVSGMSENWGHDAAHLDVLLREANYFEDLGEAERRKGVSLEWIVTTMGWIVIDRWSLWETTVNALRTSDNRPPAVYGQFEALTKRVGAELALLETARRRRLSPDYPMVHCISQDGARTDGEGYR